MLICKKWRHFSHHQFTYLKREMLLPEFFRLVKLCSSFKSNLLQMIPFCLCSFHPYFKNLPIIRIQWLICQSAKKEKYELTKTFFDRLTYIFE